MRNPGLNYDDYDDESGSDQNPEITPETTRTWLFAAMAFGAPGAVLLILMFTL